MSNVQKPDFTLFYEKTNITAEIEPSLIELTYTDYLEGQSDELSVQFEDINGKWIRQWFPTQGDKLKVAIGYQGEPLVEIGAFEIDEVEYSYHPSSITLRALSTGISKSNRTLKPKAYENTTLAQVVAMVAERLKLKVVGKIRHIPIQRITQYQERDVEFLARLAREYHHSFKIAISWYLPIKTNSGKPSLQQCWTKPSVSAFACVIALKTQQSRWKSRALIQAVKKW